MFVYARVSEIDHWTLSGVWKAGWEDQYGWEYPWTYQKVLEYATPGARVLDVGAGTGQMAQKVFDDGPKLEVHMIDTKEAFETSGAFKPQLVYHEGLVGIGHAITPHYFDIIYSVSVLEHIYEAGGEAGMMSALEDMKNLLRPGGVMIHTMDLVLDPEVYRRWLGFSIERFITATGMEILPKYLGPAPTREAMLLDPDLYFVSPERAHAMRWCGRNVGLGYFRLTGIGFILRKPEA